MSAANPFSFATIRNDVNVRRCGKGWAVSCANCWGAAFIAGWHEAVRFANSHAKECR